MLQLILFSPDSIVPSGAALLSSISILPVFYVYSYPNETQPLVTRVTRDRLSLSSPFHVPCISLATNDEIRSSCLTIFNQIELCFQAVLVPVEQLLDAVLDFDLVSPAEAVELGDINELAHRAIRF